LDYGLGVFDQRIDISGAGVVHIDDKSAVFI
jgi:hypothetical protein